MGIIKKAIDRHKAKGGAIAPAFSEQQKLLADVIDIEMYDMRQQIAEANARASEAMRRAGASPRAE